MTEAFKKWLCEKAKNKEFYDFIFITDIPLVLLIKAMWAINREGKWDIQLWKKGIDIWLVNQCYEEPEKRIEYKDHNNSEQEALTKALEYIFEQEQK